MTLPRDEQLARVLSEFARTLLTEFPIQRILDHLVERIVELLPVTAAGVTLISPGHDPHYVAASNAFGLTFERLQSTLNDGPCVEAYQTGHSVTVPNLTADNRFPRFAPAAAAAGLRAVFTFPLAHDGQRLGALDLYRDRPGSLDAWELAAAHTLADVTTAYLVNAQARAQSRETSDRFRHNALHDPLTGLPNRALLLERLDHAARRGTRDAENCLVVLFADLDRFKQVNDAHGHAVGDDVLVAVSHRLGTLLRPGDTLARMSGDEFVIVCEDIASISKVEALAHRIDEAFVAPFKVAGLDVRVTASVGVAFAGHSRDVTHGLIRFADTAMYQAKRRGGARHHIVDVGRDVLALTRPGVDLATDLRAALAQDELDLVYQPIVDSSNQRTAGAEALLRWTHPVLGRVEARDLLAVAEQANLLSQVGTWVLERACHDHQSWRVPSPASGSTDLAVNVSASQLMAHGFVSAVRAVLARTGMPAGELILEITEDAFLEDNIRARSVLTELKALGVRLALDDFGSGYSSLRYLSTFPIDSLKIDRSFVAAMTHDRTARAIVSAVTDLAHALGIRAVAEGVETQNQHDDIVAIGCDYGQGYYYASPMSASDFARQTAVPTPSRSLV